VARELVPRRVPTRLERKRTGPSGWWSPVIPSRTPGCWRPRPRARPASRPPA